MCRLHHGERHDAYWRLSIWIQVNKWQIVERQNRSLSSGARFIVVMAESGRVVAEATKHYGAFTFEESFMCVPLKEKELFLVHMSMHARFGVFFGWHNAWIIQRAIISNTLAYHSSWWWDSLRFLSPTFFSLDGCSLSYSCLHSRINLHSGWNKKIASSLCLVYFDWCAYLLPFRIRAFVRDSNIIMYVVILCEFG